MTGKPFVVFVCVSNGGKSAMAAGLLRKAAGDSVVVDSAGTDPAGAVNAVSAEALLEVGIDISDHVPQRLTDEMVAAAERVVFLGRDARVCSVGGTPVEVWDINEPSHRMVDIDRMG